MLGCSFGVGWASFIEKSISKWIQNETCEIFSPFRAVKDALKFVYLA
jgi:hypothetical protein